MKTLQNNPRFDVLKAVFKLYKNRPLLFARTFLFMQITSIFPVMTGYAIKLLFDQYALGPMNTTVYWSIGLFLSLLMGRIFFVYFTAVSNTTSRFLGSADIRLNLLGKILSKPGGEALNLSTGDALNKIKEDVNQIEDFAFSALIDFITSLVLTIFAMSILISLDWKLTLIVFTPILLMVYIMEFSGKRVSRYRLANRSATSNVSSAIGEVFSNIQAIQVNTAETSVYNHLHELNRIRAKQATQDNVFSQILGTLYENIFNIGTGLILICMAVFDYGSHFSLGNFVIFTYYMNFISFFIMFTGNAFTRYKQIQVSFENLCSLHESITPEVIIAPTGFDPKCPEKKTFVQASPPAESLVKAEIHNMTCLYPGSTNGIRNVSFTLEKGSMTVIAGRIGSGKTTLLKAFCGLLRPQSGTLLWNGTPVTAPDCFMTPPQLAYTPQIPKFFSATIKENISLGSPLESLAENRAIRLSVMAQDLEGFSDGLHTHIGTNGVKLSGGQQLRLAVARMCARDAAVYGFDDISSALDIETETSLWERLLAEQKNTYLAVSNRRSVLEQADQILLMKDGQLEGIGTLNDLLANCEEMRLLMDESS